MGWGEINANAQTKTCLCTHNSSKHTVIVHKLSQFSQHSAHYPFAHCTNGHVINIHFDLHINISKVF